jgi:hypothetical protein
LVACSSPSQAPVDAPPDIVDAPPVGCDVAPQVTRTRFLDESIAYLRSAFAVSSGFEGGSVTYGEMWVSLVDSACPLADWTALSYVVDIDPARVPLELRPMHDRVVVVWTLGGRRFLGFLPTDAPTSDAAPWKDGRLPDSFSAVASANADPNQIAALVAELAQDPLLSVVYLDQIGVLTIDAAIGTFAADVATGATVPQIDAAAEKVRVSGLLHSIEWSSFTLRIPSESWPAMVVDSTTLAPECLRQQTRGLRDDGVFTTAPGLAAPLGTGPIVRTPTCS